MIPNDAPLLIAAVAALVTALGGLWKLMDDGDGSPPPLPNGRRNGRLNGVPLLEKRVEYLEITSTRLYSMLEEQNKKLDMLISIQLRQQ